MNTEERHTSETPNAVLDTISKGIKESDKNFQFDKDGKKLKLVFKESLCRADEFGRPMRYWDPRKKEHYVVRVAEKGQACRILRELKRGEVEVEFTVVLPDPIKAGNIIMKMKKEKIAREMLEEIEA
jgi:hypothetical protein